MEAISNMFIGRAVGVADVQNMSILNMALLPLGKTGKTEPLI
jgi:hypothetical protein